MHSDAERARRPEDLGRLILERLNAGDVDGFAILYEPDAVLALPDGRIATGSGDIRKAYQRLVTDRPFEPGTQRPTLHSGDLALTSTHLANGVVTVEVARRGRHLVVGDRPAQRDPVARRSAKVLVHARHTNLGAIVLP